MTAADCRHRSIGFYSRFTSARLVYPSIATNPEEFVAFLSKYLREVPHDVVLPLYEEALALAKYRHLLPCAVRVPVPDYGPMLQLHDKRSLYQLAKRCGVHVPHTWSLPRTSPESLPYPVVLKVPQSSSARGVIRVASVKQFPAAVEYLARSHSLMLTAPLLAQRYIAGEQICSFSFAWRGNPKGTVVYRNLCEYPFTGGAGVVRETCREPEVERVSTLILRETKWHGVLGLDFIREEASGNVYLIDANPRFTPGVSLALRAGVDVLQMALGAEEPAPATQHAGTLRGLIEPLVVAWMLRALLPHAGYGRDIAMAAHLLVPKSCSRSDLFDMRDMGAMRGVGLALLDSMVDCARNGGAPLDVIRDSQFADYGA